MSKAKESESDASTALKIDLQTMATSKDDKPDRSALKLLLALFSICSIGFLFSLKGFVWFSWHFITMISGFVLLPGLAFLIKKAGGYTNTKNHGYLMILSTLMVCFGFYVIYSNKEAFGKEHFTSLHGQLGLAVTVVYIGMALFSFPALNVDWGIFKTNKVVRFIHKWSGRVATACGWVCCVYGFNTVVPDQNMQLLFAVPLMIFSIFILL